MSDVVISEAIVGQAIDELAAQFSAARRPELWRSMSELKGAGPISFPATCPSRGRRAIFSAMTSSGP